MHRTFSNLRCTRRISNVVSGRASSPYRPSELSSIRRGSGRGEARCFPLVSPTALARRRKTARLRIGINFKKIRSRIQRWTSSRLERRSIPRGNLSLMRRAFRWTRTLGCTQFRWCKVSIGQSMSRSPCLFFWENSPSCWCAPIGRFYRGDMLRLRSMNSLWWERGKTSSIRKQLVDFLS